MKNNYKRLSFAEREEISRCLAKGLNVSEIGRLLSRDKSTISREVWNATRKGMSEYRAILANFRAIRNRKKQARKRKLEVNQKLGKYVLRKLREYWSPEQIVTYLTLMYPEEKSMRVSKETIYRYIYVLPKGQLKNSLIKTLRRQHKYRYAKSRKKPSNINSIPNLVSIHQRPKSVEGRRIGGHWEGDLLLGKWRQSALGTLVERKSRQVFLVPFPKGYSHIEVAKRFSKVLSRLPEDMRQTLTYDRGPEMSSHQIITKQTKVKVYFCDPQSPWQRGTNENTNGLVRQFFPKGTDFSLIPRNEIKKAERLLNNRPRKVLNWKKPKEVFKTVLR